MVDAPIRTMGVFPTETDEDIPSDCNIETRIHIKLSEIVSDVIDSHSKQLILRWLLINNKLLRTNGIYLQKPVKAIPCYKGPQIMSL